MITKVLGHYDKKVRRFNETGRMYRSRREQYDERMKTKDEKKAMWKKKDLRVLCSLMLQKIR